MSITEKPEISTENTEILTETANERRLPWISTLAEIPQRVKTIVYLIGMLGFPIVVTGYLLLFLPSELKDVNKNLVSLAMRVDERPMSLDRTTDFIIYLCDSLQNDLKVGLPETVKSINFEVENDGRSITQKITVIDRQMESYIRPIVRKHQRFAERFPTAAGNLGSLFVLSAPGEKLDIGETEAYLRGVTNKDVGESLLAVISNNIVLFGNSRIKEEIRGLSGDSQRLEELRKILNSQDTKEEEKPAETDHPKPPNPSNSGKLELISPDLFIKLSKNAIDTVTTVLRDQMLTKAKTTSQAGSSK